MSWRRLLGLRDEGAQAPVSRLAFGCTMVAAALTWLVADHREWPFVFSALAPLAVVITGLLAAARPPSASKSTLPASLFTFSGLGEARRVWSPVWQVAICAAFVALTLVAVNVDLPAWQRVVGWVVACLALGLAVGVVSRRRVP